ncbi:alcohol dehydrogenase catalytic domain-containing protein [Candidatus Kuenenia stuttgartensis]|uniref:alcohol dehydrogenase catalytic domain-containing protein n=1 Tax=Kuenenia stuttgartiensis TaxID=174633 RepID=UPI00146AC9AE|nr:alcohol dehydrogenase catalytic domain-containing protein [Candidatus Kuenenia stuttgartiensis]
MGTEDRPVILGWDIAGIVVAVGEEVSGFEVGDKVFGMVNFPGQGKAYAEYVASPAYHIAVMPEKVTFEEAAATNLAALTALQVLRPRVKKGAPHSNPRRFWWCLDISQFRWPRDSTHM